MTSPTPPQPRADGRYNRAHVLPIASHVTELLSDVCPSLIVAGSIRRNAPTVKDIEIVATATDSRALLARLDSLVLSGQVRKAIYTDKNGRRTNRWGAKYRGIEIGGIKIEIFIATPENHGLILWLRTGPGDANHYAVMNLFPSGVTMRDGYLWHDQKRFSVPDERFLFRVFRMPLAAPEHRTESLYRTAFGNSGRKHRELPALVYVADDAPQQGSLF